MGNSPLSEELQEQTLNTLEDLLAGMFTGKRRVVYIFMNRRTTVKYYMLARLYHYIVE